MPASTTTHQSSPVRRVARRQAPDALCHHRLLVSQPADGVHQWLEHIGQQAACAAVGLRERGEGGGRKGEREGGREGGGEERTGSSGQERAACVKAKRRRRVNRSGAHGAADPAFSHAISYEQGMQQPWVLKHTSAHGGQPRSPLRPLRRTHHSTPKAP